MSGASPGPTKFLMARPKSVIGVRSSLSQGSGARGRARAASTARRRWAASVTATRSGSPSGKPVLSRICSTVTPGCIASMRMRRVSGSKPKMPSVVTTRETPPKSRPALRRAPSPPQPRRAGDEIHTGNEAALLVRGEDEHLAAQRDDVVGAAGAGQPDLRLPVVAPITLVLMLPYWSICAPPMKP